MSAWEIPLAALQSYGLTVAVILPIAVTSYMAESLILPLLVPHPRLKRRSRGRRGRKMAVALVRWGAAVVVVAAGALTTILFGLLAAGISQTTLRVLAICCLVAVAFEVVHIVLTVRSARRGARLCAGDEVWKARSKEARNNWHVLTFAMPLRAQDLFWVGLAVPFALVYPLTVFARQQAESNDSRPVSRQLALYGGIIIVLILSALLLWLLDRATPRLTLARWAADAMISPRWLGRSPRPPLGPRVALLLELCVRRRSRRLPTALRDHFLSTSGKLIEILRIAEAQQNTRHQAGRTMRQALQLSARLANSKDHSEATRIVDDWLKERGLADAVPAPLPSRRRLPTVQSVGEVTETAKKVLVLVGGLVAAIVLLINGAGLDKVLSQLK
ncbi:hypothetical protein SAMN04488546_0057 [Geodermatophilus poikilotrophus]|uniref:Uncharacterized protein n=1 Tax=Geodermatophilus poikilotrophus TaxID=1333667 RepID=A0A1H9YEE5_9ACTN|nr:hypothetical protein SAMN04488546_0057 [Geodermatophilus poikilotrophus]